MISLGNLDEKNPMESNFKSRRCQNRYMIIATIILALGIIGIITGLVVGLGGTDSEPCGENEQDHTTIMSTTKQTPQSSASPPLQPTMSPSVEGHYRYAAVASDSELCSSVGVDILAREQGTAVDAAIATLLCVCVVQFQSCGLGGGHFMTIYNRANQTVSAVIAREMAPSGADEMMYTKPNASSRLGGLSIGIPGEVKGMWEAWKLNGRVPWNRLFQPAIKLCRDGFPVTVPLAKAIKGSQKYHGSYPELRDLVTNPSTGELYKFGETARRPKLARTLDIIAVEGPDAFYNGTLSSNISLDIQDAGGIITETDLENYVATVNEPVVLKLKDGSKVHVPPTPSSGVVYEMMLNILDGYNLNKESLSIDNEPSLTWHRVVEAFKFAFAKRSLLGDVDAEDQEFKDEVEKLMKNITSADFGSYIRSQIWNNQTHDMKFYKPKFQLLEDSGTSHFSVLAPNGDAVSCTTTINFHFGSKVVGSRTGIIFNNEMDDFSTPNTTNAYGIPASTANFIKPYKRPLSSMTPAIVTGPTGDVRLLSGGSGGTKILTAVLLNTIETLWFGMGVKESIDYPRIHHQLSPDTLYVEKGFPQEFIDILRAKGHTIAMWNVTGSRVQAILRTQGKITANSDYRKHGAPDGY